MSGEGGTPLSVEARKFAEMPYWNEYEGNYVAEKLLPKLACDLDMAMENVARLTAALKEAERELKNRKEYSRLERKGWQDAARLYEQAVEDAEREREQLRRALSRIASGRYIDNDQANWLGDMAREALKEPAKEKQSDTGRVRPEPWGDPFG